MVTETNSAFLVLPKSPFSELQIIRDGVDHQQGHSCESQLVFVSRPAPRLYKQGGMGFAYRIIIESNDDKPFSFLISDPFVPNLSLNDITLPSD